ncbi:helix-turn-helix domain-containing protein [Nocardia fusca]|uniref:helix-turn-helix domain-containing protein n=1 Tax=Nocardia fusca TaxID=941183 RepID=UPI0037BB8893
MPLHIEAAHLPLCEQQDYWRSALSELYFGLDTRIPAPTDRGYACEIERITLGEAVVDRVRADPNEIDRTPRLVRTSPSDYVLLCALRSGSGIIVQSGRQAVLNRCGDFALIDTALPYTYAFTTAVEQVVVRLERANVLDRLPRLAELTARTVPGTHGVGALASSLTLALPRHGGDRDDTVADQMVDHTLALTAAAVLDNVGHDLPDLSIRAETLRRAQKYVCAHLDDPDLAPCDVARAISVSERYLYALFRDIGASPAAWIRSERLRIAHRQLADPRHRHRSVEQIARSVGFRSASQFSRVFKNEYRVTPREHRNE